MKIFKLKIGKAFADCGWLRRLKFVAFKIKKIIKNEKKDKK